MLLVEPESLLGEDALVERRYGFRAGLLSTVDVLVSHDVPQCRRKMVMDAALRGLIESVVANDCAQPESAAPEVAKV